MTHIEKAERTRLSAIARRLGYLGFCKGSVAEPNEQGSPNRYHHEFDFEYYVELIRHRANGRSS